jgi:hypothetical protein
MISTLLFRSGMKISNTSYIAPAFPVLSVGMPRSAADHTFSSFFLADMIPFNEAYRG